MTLVEVELRRWYGVEPLRVDDTVHADLPLVRRGARSLKQWFSVVVSTAIGAAVGGLSWATRWMGLGTGVQALRNRCDAALGPAGRPTSA